MTKEELEYYLLKEYGENGFPQAKVGATNDPNGGADDILVTNIEVVDTSGNSTVLNATSFRQAASDFMRANPRS